MIFQAIRFMSQVPSDQCGAWRYMQALCRSVPPARSSPVTFSYFFVTKQLTVQTWKARQTPAGQTWSQDVLALVARERRFQAANGIGQKCLALYALRNWASNIFHHPGNLLTIFYFFHLFSSPFFLPSPFPTIE